MGLVETAAGGTLFLDEIGDLDPALQAKLLKLLEEKTVRRLGGLRDQKVDVRIVAATHRSLEEQVRAERFRADLYFRLRIVELKVPPLRARGDDVLLLAHRFLEMHAARYGRGAMTLDAGAKGLLTRHRWPGNVRELRNLMEQAVLLSTGNVLEAEDLHLSPLPLAEEARPTPASGEEPMNLEDAERSLLVSALQKTGYNVTQAARLLGITRDTLRYRMEKYRLGPGGTP